MPPVHLPMLLLLLGATEAAAGAPEIVPVTLLEQTRDRAATSGFRPVARNAVVGLTLGGGDGAPLRPLDRLGVVLPEAPEPRLCGRLESRDGSYFAWFDEPRGGRRGPVVLKLRRPRAVPVPTKDAEFLAVLVYLAERCDGGPRRILAVTPAEVGPPATGATGAPRRLTALVSSGRSAATLVVPGGDGRPHRAACRSLATDDLVVFDKVCTIELAESAGLAEAYVELRSGTVVDRVPLRPPGG